MRKEKSIKLLVSDEIKFPLLGSRLFSAILAFAHHWKLDYDNLNLSKSELKLIKVLNYQNK